MLHIKWLWYILGRLPLGCLILICMSLEINHRILFKFEHSLLLIHVHVQFIFFYFFLSFIFLHKATSVKGNLLQMLIETFPL